MSVNLRVEVCLLVQKSSFGPKNLIGCEHDEGWFDLIHRINPLISKCYVSIWILGLSKISFVEGEDCVRTRVYVCIRVYKCFHTNFSSSVNIEHSTFPLGDITVPLRDLHESKARAFLSVMFCWTPLEVDCLSVVTTKCPARKLYKVATEVYFCLALKTYSLHHPRLSTKFS